MFRGRHRRARRQSLVFELETLNTPQIVLLHDGAILKLRPLNGKSKQALALGVLALGEIPSQSDHMQSADRAHIEHVALLQFAHISPS